MTKRTYTRAYATARFRAADLDPMIVTQSLLLPPDDQYRRGEPRLIRTQCGKVEQRSPYKMGSWSMTSERWVNSPRLHIHLLWLLEQLEPRRNEIALLLSDGVVADFFCYSSGSTSTPPAIPQPVLDRSNALGFSVVIDHYDSSGDQYGG